MLKKGILTAVLVLFAVSAQAQRIKYAPLTESQKQTVKAPRRQPSRPTPLRAVLRSPPVRIEERPAAANAP